MHPPDWNPNHHLSDWPECILEIHCEACPYARAYFPIKLLLKERGDATFSAILPRLKCKKCGARAGPVYLVAGNHREFCGGARPNWALELVPGAR